jgi:NCS2 family nucleobase:cation symporter-2
MQQVLIGILGIAFTIVIFHGAHLSESELINKLQLLLVVFAVGCFLQITCHRHVGSGLFLPPLSGAIYVQACIIAIHSGGVELMAGMVIFAGFCEFLLSFVIRKIRFLFPPEICGLVILLVGLELGVVSFTTTVVPPYTQNATVFTVTILPIIVFGVWGKHYIRHICSFIGILVGGLYVSYVADTPFLNEAVLKQLPLFALPKVGGIGQLKLSFDPALYIPFFLAAFAATLRTIGLAISLQQFEDEAWRKPNYLPINRGIRADSIASMLAGFFGLNGVNVSPTATTLALASRYTGRDMALVISTLFLILACIPKVLYIVSVAPLAVVGAVLMYYAAFIFTSGIRMLGSSAAIGIRQVYTISIPFFLAISVYITPELYQKLPYPFNFIGRSSLSVGIIAALVLNLFFHLGSFRKKTFTLRMEGQNDVLISQKIYEYGHAWRLNSNLIENCTLIAREIVTQINHIGLADSAVLVEVKQSSESFKLIFSYHGTPLRVTVDRGVDTERDVDEQVVFKGIRAFLTGIYPDEVLAKSNGKEYTLTLVFHHY